MKYRPEIDGLRALTIIPVIFFHAGFEIFNGGYVGVDVFFVISGYLITTILINDIENKRFSILNFYERRARRILPALFFMMIVCIPIAWLLMMPNQMKDFSQSLIAVSFFVSNILFWRKTGYFSTSAEEKPLLHTWSLAVEEQYYLLFPIFLILAWKFGRNKVFWMIILFASISLLLSEWGWRNQSRANFYLAPTRVWEIFAGSIAAFLVKKHGTQSNNFLSFIGLFAIVCSVFVYDRSTPFPSIYGLFPVIGAVILIVFSNKETYVSKILSSKFLVSVGLISYSAYLWHQPLFAFTRINLDEKPDELLMFIIVILSFLIGYLSWKFIEIPFRDKQKIKKNFFIFCISFIFLITITIGFTGHITNGFKEQMLNYKYKNENKKLYRAVFDSTNYNMYNHMQLNNCNIWVKNTKELKQKKLDFCFKKYGKGLIVLGDSHAMNLYNIISKSKKFNFVIGVSQGGCRPHNNHKNCHYNDFEKFLLKNISKIKKIIYHQSGSYYIKSINGSVDSQAAFEGKFDSFHKNNILKTLSYLNSLAEKFSINILWVGPFTEYRHDPLNVIGKEESFSINPTSIKLFNDLNKKLSTILSNERSIKYLPYSKIFYEPVKSYISECFVFLNIDHYSLCGEDIIASKSKLNLIDY